MSTRRIVNASPLILPTKIGRIDLLHAEDIDVIVPMAVLQEVSFPADPSDPWSEQSMTPAGKSRWYRSRYPTR